MIMKNLTLDQVASEYNKRKTMDMSNVILNALLKEAQAKEAKAIALLQNYFSNSAGIGEHPDIVAECSKLLHDLQEARDSISLINDLMPKPEGENTDGK